MHKAEIREMAHALGLPNWNKPSAACLASRFPYGAAVTTERLAQVAAALFGQLIGPLKDRGWFAPFSRVLLHDSTVEPLPQALAGAFPGPANGRPRRYACRRRSRRGASG